MKVPYTKPILPNKEDYKGIIDELWETRMLSNFAKYSQKMELEAKNYFESERNFLSVVSCDVGLNLLIRAHKFPTDAEVIVPSFTFNSTANNIVLNNLKPIFVDIDPETFNMDIQDIASKITSKTVAILGVHVFGNPCNAVELESLADSHNLKLFFDSAHAFGSEINGKHISQYGDAGAYSFSGTKLITSAEGGLVYIKDPDIAEEFKKLRNYGFYLDYNTKSIGMNGKISEFHSGLAYLAILDIRKSLKRRKEVADKYLKELNGFTFQKVLTGSSSTYKDFAVLTKNSEKIIEELKAKEIQTKKYFFPNHMTDYFKTTEVSLPVTEDVYKNIICIPMFNDITEEEQDFVIKSLNEATR